MPLRPNDKRPAGHSEQLCPQTGRCTGGHLKPEQRATTDTELITAAWTQQPYNIGIATGPSGLLVIDLDMLKPSEPEGTPDGAASLQALCERAGQTLPATYQVRTPSGGQHLYFTPPPGVRLGNTANRLGHHIDTRGWGGYVVAPASTTPEGSYSLCDDRPPATRTGSAKPSRSHRGLSARLRRRSPRQRSDTRLLRCGVRCPTWPRQGTAPATPCCCGPRGLWGG
ncbi:bifunctional DNA primase/polymerase [Streptomyces sp. NPDC060187]|uniref:bifunctional DNA primase/polymerase n=1 Tax=Streptomyces sp. NPDC060187 TaxID=3347067 RepID=UPI0036637A67